MEVVMQVSMVVPVLLVMPAVGGVQVPGVVVTPTDVGLTVVFSSLQTHLVLIVWAGPFWLYVGTVELQLVPLLVV